MPEENRVHLRDAEGRAFSVDASEAAEALRGGEFRRATDEEIAEHARKKAATTTGSKALALGEGVVRGATFGLGTAALAEGLGDEYRENARARAEHNRGLSIGGEVVGTVLPTLLSGGSGAVAAGARLAPAALAGRVAMGAERGAAALARGAGLTGEGLLSSSAAAAIRSGAGASAETALYGLGSSLADSALEGTDWTAERALSGLGEGALFGLKAGGALGAGRVAATRAARAAGREVVNSMASGANTFRRAVENWAQGVGSAGLTRGADDAKSLITRLTEHGENPQRLQRIAERFKAAGVGEGASRAELSAVARSEAAMAAAKHAEVAGAIAARGVAPDAAAVRGAVRDAYERLARSEAPDAKAAAGRLKSLMSAKPRTIAEAEAIQAKLDGAVSWARSTKATALPELEKLHAKVSSHIDELAPPEVAGAWKDARQSAGDWKALTQKLGKEPLTDAEIGRVIGLAGSAASIATGSVVPFLGAAIVGQNPAVRQFARERGGQALSWLASRAGWAEKSVATAADKLAAIESPARSILGGATTGKQAKTKRGVVESAQTYPVSREETATRYAALSANILQSQQDPAALTQRIGATLEPIAGAQPEVAAAMAMRMVGDYSYLASKLPPGPDPASLIIHAQNEGPPLVSKLDQERILRYASALDDPPGTLEALGRGEINWEGADALRDRRPLLWEGFRVRTLMAVAQRKEPLPYKRRAYLSVLFGTPLDPSLAPGAVPMPPPPEAGAPQPGSPGKLNPDKAGALMATPAQRVGGMT